MMVAAPINHISLDERGIAYITGTRIKVRHIAIERNVWKKPAEAIQFDFPQLSLGQIYAAIAYYCDNQEHIDKEIAEEARLADSIRLGQPAQLSRQGLLDRLQSKDPGNQA